MNSDPDGNGDGNGKQDKRPTMTRNQAVNHHLAVIGAIALAWFLLLVFVIIDHAGEIIRIFRLLGLVFLGYLIYATISILRNWKKWKP